MKVCVIGSGGREHALAHVLARSADVVVTPGNPGIPGSVDTAPEALDADLYVVGPEVPLVDGVADRLRAAGKRVFGPGGAGAQLEGSKAWMKALLVAAGVPTAGYGSFTDESEAVAFLRSLPGPWVVKTDGLAAGKGVLVTDSLAEATHDVRAKLAGESFGAAGRTVVIEEALTGPELSVLALCDGKRAVPLAPAQDYKRVGDGDAGPNTGGMGAYSPVPFVDGGLIGDVMDRFVEPTLAELRRRDIDYRGVLYGGLMLTPEGPRLLEYNVRFGDPEAQVVLPRLDPDQCDLLELLGECASGHLHSEPVFVADAAVTVVLATDGYPASPRTGDVIEGIDKARDAGATVFCAGVGSDGSGRLVTSGGRVVNVTGFGPDLDAARDRAYTAVACIAWPGVHYRTDIARDVARQNRS
ncbi:MAG: phosphoribosylamine--glycine ligase [Acidimicrobiales bacterium]